MNSPNHLVFTVTSGRSGTKYLAQALNEFKNVTSLHEPDPNFKDYMVKSQFDKDEAITFWKERKLPQIFKTVTTPVYIETSHLFSKGFALPLLELGVVPDLIILVRPERQVASSLYRMGIIPYKTRLGKRWFLSPDYPNTLVKITQNPFKLHDYQLCYWYCLEVRERQNYLRDIFKKSGSTIFDVGFQDLVSDRHKALQEIKYAYGLHNKFHPPFSSALNKNKKGVYGNGELTGEEKNDLENDLLKNIEIYKSLNKIWI